MAYKLNEQVLHPQSTEKTNVKLADAAFHESTINALTYYAAHGYENFKDSAIFTVVKIADNCSAVTSCINYFINVKKKMIG